MLYDIGYNTCTERNGWLSAFAQPTMIFMSIDGRRTSVLSDRLNC